MTTQDCFVYKTVIYWVCCGLSEYYQCGLSQRLTTNRCEICGNREKSASLLHVSLELPDVSHSDYVVKDKFVSPKSL